MISNSLNLSLSHVQVANLLTTDREADLIDYIHTPIGKGKVVTSPLSPVIAVPTTSGTGSETTGVAIFDLLSMKVSTFHCLIVTMAVRQRSALARGR